MKAFNLLLSLVLIGLAALLSGKENASAQNPTTLPTAQSNQNETAPNEQSRIQEAITPSAVLSSATTTSQPSPTPNSHAATGNSKGWNDWFWRNLATLLLVLAAIWAACVAIRTLAQIRCQAVLGEKAAQAADRSAKTAEQALNNLERPWVFPHFVGEQPFQGWNRFWPAKTEKMKLQLYWTYENFGRSPAFVFDGM